MTETAEVVAAADAMRLKRADLQAQPLAMIYVQLARAAVEAAAIVREQARKDNCKHPRRIGNGFASSDGSSSMIWSCPDCGGSEKSSTPARSTRREDWHYDSRGYCDNPGRGY